MVSLHANKMAGIRNWWWWRWNQLRYINFNVRFLLFLCGLKNFALHRILINTTAFKTTVFTRSTGIVSSILTRYFIEILTQWQAVWTRVKRDIEYISSTTETFSFTAAVFFQTLLSRFLELIKKLTNEHVWLRVRVYMCVWCVCMCTCAYTCVYVYTHIHVCVWCVWRVCTCLSLCAHTCMSMCVSVWARICVWCVSGCVCLSLCMCVTCVPVYAYVCIRVCACCKHNAQSYFYLICVALIIDCLIERMATLSLKPRVQTVIFIRLRVTPGRTQASQRLLPPTRIADV